METPLVGYLRYRLQLTPTTSAAQPQEQAAAAVKTLNFPFAGWVFENETCVFPALLPQGLIDWLARRQTTTNATTSYQDAQVQIRIDRYIRTSLLIAMSVPKGASKSVPAIRVLENGLACLNETKPRIPPLSSEANLDDGFTLSQIAKLEHLQHFPSMISLVGRVEAVSPLITVEPHDPFCLVQLRQSTPRADYTVIVLLRKHGASRWSLIKPGHFVFFGNAKRQGWRIPAVLADRQPRQVPPDHVFVVEQASQIVVQQQDGDDKEQICPALAGRITDIQYVRLASETCTTINYVKLDTTRNRNSSHHRPCPTTKTHETFLFLTYFPMDTSLQASLCVGVEIAGFHLKCLEKYMAFEATLRSSLVVTKLADTATCRRPKTKEQQPVLRDNPLKYVRKIPVPCFVIWRRLWIQCWLDHVLASNNDETLERSVLENNLYRHVYGPETRKESTTHNPYREFFDCRRRQDEEELSSRLFQLGHLRDALLSRAKLYLQEHLKTVDDSKTSGWTASFSFDRSDLADGHPIYTGGFATGCSLERNRPPSGFTLTSGRVTVPVLFDQALTLPAKSLVLLQIRESIMSVFCLRGSTTALAPNIMDVPRLESEDVTTVAEIGCTRIFIVEGTAYLCSMTLIGEVVDVSNPREACCSVPPSSRNTQFKHFSSIQTFLHRPLHEDTADEQIISALLVRKAITFRKAKHEKFAGLCLTLSHLPRADASSEQVCSMQSIDLKPRICIENGARWRMKHILEKLFGQTCSVELTDTAAAWCKLAESCCTCSLITGGWDEISGSMRETAMLRHVRVQFHSSAMELDTKRGYVRLGCPMDDVWCCLGSFPGKQSIRSTNHTFDFSSGNNFFQGMLDRRPSRIGQSFAIPTIHARGQLAEIPDTSCAGVSSCSIAKLHEQQCLVLRDDSRRHSVPSLVCEIQGARFLGIRFCVVFAECRKCFQKLVLSKNASKTTRRDGKESSSQSYGSDLDPFRPTKRRRQTMLCPNGCDHSNFGIRWELSGTLDDGTAQAKLYAERDTAISLLRMDQRSVDMIEDGVWNMDDGLLFSPAVPARPHLRTTVASAKALARSKQRLVRLDEETVLRHMSVAGRAEYLFQVHCRRKQAQVVPSTFYVRCKPLSKEVTTVNHTEMSVTSSYDGRYNHERIVDAVSRKGVTYTLPSITLNLVDIATPFAHNVRHRQKS